MDVYSGAAAVLSLSLSLARAASQARSMFAIGSATGELARCNRALGAACAVAGVLCRCVSGIDEWLTCAALLNATASLLGLLPHASTVRGRKALTAGAPSA